MKYLRNWFIATTLCCFMLSMTEYRVYGPTDIPEVRIHKVSIGPASNIYIGFSYFVNCDYRGSAWEWELRLPHYMRIWAGKNGSGNYETWMET